MKLQHLAIGDRFEYNGDVYVKTGPLTAASEKGGQRVIPRSAVLRPVGAADAAPAAASSSLERQRVAAAFATFYASCSGLVGDNDRRELDLARRRFLSSLGLGSGD
ncbi:MAG: hypothetical protein CVU18_07450 [Betaproteobacteria bacterium HGW-Betaproteobacteria-12]|nr:MAG: hypothetical protein CVU18_07450 [Betaproteobacteria bacterium HGW-Betaproteobacteria-12]